MKSYTKYICERAGKLNVTCGDVQYLPGQQAYPMSGLSVGTQGAPPYTALLHTQDGPEFLRRRRKRERRAD